MNQKIPGTDTAERIGSEGTEPVGAQPRSGEPRKRELEEELDAALACTFPASDPVGCLGTDLNCRKELNRD
jgi:hypothetical protein